MISFILALILIIGIVSFAVMLWMFFKYYFEDPIQYRIRFKLNGNTKEFKVQIKRLIGWRTISIVNSIQQGHDLILEHQRSNYNSNIVFKTEFPRR